MENNIKIKEFIEDMIKPYYTLINTVHEWAKENKQNTIKSIVFDVKSNKLIDPNNKIDPEGFKRVIKVFYE